MTRESVEAICRAVVNERDFLMEENRIEKAKNVECATKELLEILPEKEVERFRGVLKWYGMSL